MSTRQAIFRESALVRLTIWNRDSNPVINSLKVVRQTFASWNQLDGWLRQVDGLRTVA